MPILVLKVLNLGKIVLVVGISRERKTLWRQKKKQQNRLKITQNLNHKSEDNHKSTRKSIN